jgi:hypothetical protein
MAVPPPVPPGPGKPRVLFAVYGGVKDGEIQAKIVTNFLQKAINDKPGEKVPIDNNTMVGGPDGDPFGRVHKQFGAIVEVKPGQVRAFVGDEGQTIDFTP